MPSLPRQRLALIVLLSAIVLPAVSVAAQDAREFERRVDEAMALRSAALADLAVQRARKVPLPVFADTVSLLGGLRLVTTRELLPLVRESAALADSFVRHRAGGDLSRLPASVLAVWTDDAHRAENGVLIAPRVNDGVGNQRSVFATSGGIARFLKFHAQSMIVGERHPLVSEWVGGSLPIDSLTNTEWRELRLELVSSRSTVARRCYAGDLTACKATLGVTKEPYPETQWYDSATRRALVEHANATVGNQVDRRSARACLANLDSACIHVMRTSPALTMWSQPPGSRRARMTLVQQAFETGGAGGLTRFATAADSPAEAISAIAGEPLDSVVARWQRRAHDGGIESEIATPVIALTALAWVLVLGALSLRSPRWR